MRRLRTVALAAATGALLTAGAATTAAAVTVDPGTDTTPASKTGDGVALVKNNALTPWTVVDFVLGSDEE
ncbi:hypothetical protein ACFPM3_05920 [Streptomyces coeruleoprunus]|uniref:Uncharacterized protein n=1 Tax=Streptomyces coeruleoprunus TaxID=285563 RepID=A0ABV9X9X8_9ACTN